MFVAWQKARKIEDILPTTRPSPPRPYPLLSSLSGYGMLFYIIGEL